MKNNFFPLFWCPGSKKKRLLRPVTNTLGNDVIGWIASDFHCFAQETSHFRKVHLTVTTSSAVFQNNIPTTNVCQCSLSHSELPNSRSIGPPDVCSGTLFGLIESRYSRQFQDPTNSLVSKLDNFILQVICLQYGCSHSPDWSAVDDNRQMGTTKANTGAADIYQPHHSILHQQPPPTSKSSRSSDKQRHKNICASRRNYHSYQKQKWMTQLHETNFP